jgi:hypothetical protein
VNLQPIVDELTYQNYAANRAYAPHVSPERWGRLYPNVKEMEARYLAELAILRAKEESKA